MSSGTTTANVSGLERGLRGGANNSEGSGSNQCSEMNEACVKGGCCGELVCTDETGMGLEDKFCVEPSMCKEVRQMLFL